MAGFHLKFAKVLYLLLPWRHRLFHGLTLVVGWVKINHVFKHIELCHSFGRNESVAACGYFLFAEKVFEHCKTAQGLPFCS